MVKKGFSKMRDKFFVTLALLALISVPVEAGLLILVLTGVLEMSWFLLIPVGIIVIFLVAMQVDIIMALNEYGRLF